MQLPTPAQFCDCLPTQTTHRAPILAHTIRESKNWLAAHQFSHQCDSVECYPSLPTVRCMLAPPSIESMFPYEPRYFLNRTGVYNDYKLQYKVQMNQSPKWNINYHRRCTTLKPDGRHSSDNLHHCAYVREDIKLLNWRVRYDYKLLLTGTAESSRWLWVFLPMSLQQLKSTCISRWERFRSVYAHERPWWH